MNKSARVALSREGREKKIYPPEANNARVTDFAPNILCLLGDISPDTSHISPQKNNRASIHTRYYLERKRRKDAIVRPSCEKKRKNKKKNNNCSHVFAWNDQKALFGSYFPRYQRKSRKRLERNRFFFFPLSSPPVQYCCHIKCQPPIVRS